MNAYDEIALELTKLYVHNNTARQYTLKPKDITGAFLEFRKAAKSQDTEKQQLQQSSQNTHHLDKS
ncbi:MAG: hypothetical protein K2N54_04830 [Helicobacter sp.]|nr:hypothetical protein [Helicobacter sp.]MDE7255485.1 hypothetical protein [Helicobacter sp.]